MHSLHFLTADRKAVRNAIGFAVLFLLSSLSVVYAQDAIPVEAVTTKRGNISEFEYAQGTVKAARREYLVFENSGRVAYVKTNTSGGLLREGDLVTGPGKKFKEGELLAELDRGQSDASLKAAQAELDRARIQLRSADKELKRAKTLMEKNVINKKRLEDTQAQYDQAIASVRSAEARIDEVRTGERRNQLRAPFNGRVAFINIREGQYVGPQQFNPANESQAARTAPIVVIDPSSFEILVDLPVFVGSRVKVGQRAYLLDQEALAVLQARGDGEVGRMVFQKLLVPAQVTSISPAVNPEDRSIRARIETDKASDKLLDGGYITVWIEVAVREKATIIPMSAVLTRGSQYFTHVIGKDGTVKRQKLKLGILSPDGVEVLNGVSPGDRVVTKGKARIKDGSKVKVVSQGADNG